MWRAAVPGRPATQPTRADFLLDKGGKGDDNKYDKKTATTFRDLLCHIEQWLPRWARVILEFCAFHDAIEQVWPDVTTWEPYFEATSLEAGHLLVFCQSVEKKLFESIGLPQTMVAHTSKLLKELKYRLNKVMMHNPTLPAQLLDRGSAVHMFVVWMYNNSERPEQALQTMPRVLKDHGRSEYNGFTIEATRVNGGHPLTFAIDTTNRRIGSTAGPWNSARNKSAGSDSNALRWMHTWSVTSRDHRLDEQTRAVYKCLYEEYKAQQEKTGANTARTRDECKHISRRNERFSDALRTCEKHPADKYWHSLDGMKSSFKRKSPCPFCQCSYPHMEVETNAYADSAVTDMHDDRAYACAEVELHNPLLVLSREGEITCAECARSSDGQA